ncbi:MAG TPA: DNA glycosylase, partial [Candidatus Dojkabacteria bacterium]|nr:DNA glycosylase [Candidatus Dojkabacteria bacterium]
MNKLYLPNFNLYATLLGGQSFSWNKVEGEEDSFVGTTSSHLIKVKRVGENIFWQTYPKKDDLDYFSKYFRLNDNYEDIVNKYPKDEYVKKALERFKDIRILQQEFEDALIGYICSSNKNIKGIRVCIRNLSEKFGEEIEVEGDKYKLFPKIEKLSKAEISELLETKIGFRAKYVKEASERYVKGEFENINNEDYEVAKSRLIQLKGVGDKVADCVLLYSLKHDHVLPLDVWGKRIV